MSLIRLPNIHPFSTTPHVAKNPHILSILHPAPRYVHLLPSKMCWVWVRFFLDA